MESLLELFYAQTFHIAGERLDCIELGECKVCSSVSSLTISRVVNQDFLRFR